MSWEKRSDKIELMDLGPEFYTEKEYDDCLFKLDRVGRWLGGDQATFKALQNVSPKSILDVGCGGGFFTIKLAKMFPEAKVVGIDISQEAILFAKKQLAKMPKPPLNVVFLHQNDKKLMEPKKSFDIVLSTLVCHHIPDKDLSDFIQRCCSIAKKKVILNDLHRHPIPYYLFKMISPVFFRNRLIQHDGPISNLRAFKRHELEKYLTDAGIPSSCYSIKRRWAYRWVVEIKT